MVSRGKNSSQRGHSCSEEVLRPDNWVGDLRGEVAGDWEGGVGDTGNWTGGEVLQTLSSYNWMNNSLIFQLIN